MAKSFRVSDGLRVPSQITTMRDLLKEISFRLLPKFSLPKDRASILMYHSISLRKDYFSAISPKVFNQQMAYLTATKQKVISLAELVHRLRTQEPLGGSIVLTLDDGYHDNYTTVFPILRQYNLPATIFVTTSLIGNSEYCSLEELREMHDSGLIAIEPHTLTHSKLAGLPRAEVECELRESRCALESILGVVPTLFSYPYGSFSEETMNIVHEVGFAGAVTVEEGTVGSNFNPLCLPRNSIDRSTTFSQFRGKISRAIDWYTVLKAFFNI